MKALQATEIVNVVEDGDAVRMVCQFCGRMTGRRAEAGLAGLPLGWACAPYPAGFRHADGSTGDLYTCPACDKRTDFPITPREYMRKTTEHEIRCGRYTWDAFAVGSEDRLTQPDGNPCGGRFMPLADVEVGGQ